ncbi:WecB/TagA/CpsF family glycosyltransferase [Spirulina sp. CCNP1310]|uniref:WecB/TagA/CpsF family glycosyltransferase n=1 Tax=Spirulina sp. CCNP1310 TaxID=3110249 RepID=UPI002B1EE290|nr:WecB/TagA/CpsF family glycosyltransferase [Spirulina sp. CCNP1310]
MLTQPMQEMPVPPEKVSVLGLPLHLSPDYAQWWRSRPQSGTHIITLNAEMAMLAERTPELAAILHGADLIVPDGAGVIFYLWLRRKKQHRCPGIELAAQLIEELGRDAQPRTLVFFGAAPEVAEVAAQGWRSRFPRLTIHTQHGYLNPDEQRDFAQQLAQWQPDLILVGLGVPRQEYWIAQHRHLCPQATWIGIGGSFDIWAGTKQRAPRWLRENHLEWLYRLYKEPWRWRRMLVLPHFAWRSLWP